MHFGASIVPLIMITQMSQIVILLHLFFVKKYDFTVPSVQQGQDYAHGID